MFNDEWMRRWGFLEEPLDGTLTVTDVLTRSGPQDGRHQTDGSRPPFVTVEMTETMALAAATLPAFGAGTAVDHTSSTADPAAALIVTSRTSRTHGISATEVIGSLSATRLIADLAAGRGQSDDPISGHADPPPPTIGAGQSLHDALEALGSAGTGPDTILVLRDGRAHAILTRAALLSAAERRRPRL